LQPLWAKDNLMKGANLLTDMILWQWVCSITFELFAA
jgi:hypothetical protein